MEPCTHVTHSANFGHIRLPNKNSIWARSPFHPKNRRACLRGYWYFRKFEHSFPERNAIFAWKHAIHICWIFSYVNLCSCLSCSINGLFAGPILQLPSHAVFPWSFSSEDVEYFKAAIVGKPWEMWKGGQNVRVTRFQGSFSSCQKWGC